MKLGDINAMKEWVNARDFDTAMVEIQHDNGLGNCVTKRMKKRNIVKWSRYVHLKNGKDGTTVTYACGCVDYFFNSIHERTEWCGVCKHPHF